MRRTILVSFSALLVLGALVKAASTPVYDEKADARHDISSAVAEAGKSKKHVVLVFGANWCPDCHALDAQMHKGELATLMRDGFIVVKVDIGRHDKNLDLAREYKVPLEEGIPALAVLDSSGHRLYSMEQGQFADARNMSYDSIKGFFEKWKPRP